MPELTAADYAFTGYLAEQQARYDTAEGRAALERERRVSLTPTEVAWQRHIEAADRAATHKAVHELDVRRLTRERMLAQIDADYDNTIRFRTALNEGHAA